MDRIAEAFAAARQADRALFVAFVCAGDPDPETSYEVCRALLDAGIGILELGVPFSDPLADGLTNQLAAERALAAGMTQAGVFALVRRLRAETEIPIVLYTYYNMVSAPGLTPYVKAAREAGVDGLLTLDLPPEEAGELNAACAAEGLKTVYIVAPTTPEARVPVIAEAATGFLYYVSREGVTGVRSDLAEGIGGSLEMIRRHSTLPVVVGFGIGNARQVAEVAALADGVVVGSALVNCIPAHPDDPAAAVAAVGAKARELLRGLD